MAKIDLGKILATAVTIGAATVAASDSNKMESKDATAVVKATNQAVKDSGEIAQVQNHIDVLTNNEPFYMSIQWWTAMLGIAGTVAGAVGYTFPADMQKDVLALIAGLIGVGTTIAMLYNRYIRRPAIVADLTTKK